MQSRMVAQIPRHSAPGKRNSGFEGKMLIAPLAAKKKKKIYMQAEWKEFIHKILDLLCLKKALSSAHVTLVNWEEESFKVHTHTEKNCAETVNLPRTSKQNLGTFS